MLARCIRLTKTPFRSLTATVLILALVGSSPTYGKNHAETPAVAGVGIVRGGPVWPGDAMGEGAGEFDVYLRVATLQKQFRMVGLVGVREQAGNFSCGTERGLQQMSLRGVPVAKLTPKKGDAILLDTDGLFLDAGRLNETETCQTLVKCLERFGPPPAVADVDHPCAAELAAIRSHLERYQQAFTILNSGRVAQQ